MSAPADRTDRTGTGWPAGLLARPGRSPLLVAFVATVAVALGVDAGAIGPVALVVAGPLGVVAGACLLGSRDAWPRSIGSTVLSTGLLVTAVALLAGTSGGSLGVDAANSVGSIGVLLAIGCGVGGVGYAVLADRGGWRHLRTALCDSAVAATVLTPILVVALDGRGPTLLLLGGWQFASGVTPSPGVALVSLQVLGLGAILAVIVAAPAINRVSPDRVSVPTGPDVLERVRSWPSIRYWLLGGYAACWFVPGVVSTVDAALGSLGALGAAVGTLLVSGVVHALLVWTIVVGVTIALGAVLASPGRKWLEPNPIETASFAAGGAVAPVVVIGGGAVGTGQSPTLLAGLAVLALLALAPIWWVVTRVIADTGLTRSHLLGVSAALLFVATIGLASALSSIAVLLGVATALLAWDLGTASLAMHRLTDSRTAASEPLAAHAVTSVAIVTIGCCLAGAAIVAATVGASAIAFDGAQVTVAFVLVGVLVVATVAVRRPSLSVATGVVDRGRRAGRWLLTTPIGLFLCCVAVGLLLGRFVDARFYLVTVVCAIVVPSLLIGDPTGDWDRPRTRF